MLYVPRDHAVHDLMSGGADLCAALLDGGIAVQRAILDSALSNGSSQSSPPAEAQRWMSWHMARFWVAAVSEVCTVTAGSAGAAADVTLQFTSCSEQSMTRLCTPVCSSFLSW